MIDWASFLWIIGDRRKTKAVVTNERRKLPRLQASFKRMDDSIENFSQTLTARCAAKK